MELSSGRAPRRLTTAAAASDGSGMVVASAAFAAGQVVGVALLVAIVTGVVRTLTHDDPVVPDNAAAPDDGRG